MILWGNLTIDAMNSAKTFLKSLMLLLVAVSCVNITEEIRLNKDGSGEYLVYSDMVSSTRVMMTEMMGSIYPDASDDSIKQLVDEKIWSQFPSKVDSLIDFSARVPDSVKNDPENQKFLESMQMFMKGGKEEGFLNSGMSYQFTDMEDLQAFQQFLDDNQSPGSGGMDLPKTKVQYQYDGKSFSRTTILEEPLEMNDSTVNALKGLLDDSKWRLIVYLPKKAKKVSKRKR